MRLLTIGFTCLLVYHVALLLAEMWEDKWLGRGRD